MPPLVSTGAKVVYKSELRDYRDGLEKIVRSNKRGTAEILVACDKHVEQRQTGPDTMCNRDGYVAAAQVTSTCTTHAERAHKVGRPGEAGDTLIVRAAERGRS